MFLFPWSVLSLAHTNCNVSWMKLTAEKQLRQKWQSKFKRMSPCDLYAQFENFNGKDTNCCLNVSM